MIRQWFKSRPSSEDLDKGLEENTAATKRNQFVMLALVAAIGLGYLGFKHAKQWKANNRHTPTVTEESVDFGEIISDDFTEKDNRSALSIQKQRTDDLEGRVDELLKAIEQQDSANQSRVDKLTRENQSLKDKFTQELMRSKEQTNTNNNDGDVFGTPEQASAQTPTTFGQRPLPPKPIASYDTDKIEDESFQYSSSDEVSFNANAFDSMDFFWESEPAVPYRRTIENYVPSGTFVTAKITGGADANAGVYGQSDTAPIVFQTVHEGILPNGKKSRLKNCTIIGSVYGELSSSRGIVRTNSMSCIFNDGQILDIPVQGTAFNFGRNGIRGTAILRNGKIVQMAGVSGILTGIGETGAELASTTSVSALGSTSSIEADDAALNLLGNASSSVGSKLADYYIKLAEQYHPIIEINPGGLVNIVFTQGFPLDEEGIARYEQKMEEDKADQSANNSILETIINNPLADDVTARFE